jgi:CRP/FNR family transcriptional regulator
MQKREHAKTASLPCAACKAAGVPCAVESQATSLRTRRGQRFTFGRDGADAAFIVRSGVLMLEVGLPGGPRQIADLFFPGDLLRPCFLPPATESALIAANSGELWRLRDAALDKLAASDPAVGDYLDRAVARRIARQAIHALTLGQFDAEQKVATLLTELALRLGGPTAAGALAFGMPFDRKEIALYLGLNPDTLSRIMSRFKRAGLISQPERSRALVRDLSALAARSPAARSLTEIGRDRRQDEALGAAL